MNELRDWLKDGDPVVHEPPLSGADVQRMRRAVVAAGEAQEPPLVDWARGSWAAATVIVALTIAAGVNRWFAPLPDSRNVDVPAVSTDIPASGRLRQVQMIAPGGTRVIWIFNPDFKP